MIDACRCAARRCPNLHSREAFVRRAEAIFKDANVYHPHPFPY
jgi:hypothetical protein